MLHQINQEQALDKIKATKGEFFTAEFIKKDGNFRRLNCRTGVSKNTTGKGMRFDPFTKGLIPVFDAQKPDEKSFRMIPLDRLLLLNINHQIYVLS